MVAPRGKLATFADLAALGDDVSAEIIHGAITEMATPSAEHSGAQLTFGLVLGRRFQRGPGGRWPGGWWLATEIEVQYETHGSHVRLVRSPDAVAVTRRTRTKLVEVSGVCVGSRVATSTAHAAAPPGFARPVLLRDPTLPGAPLFHAAGCGHG